MSGPGHPILTLVPYRPGLSALNCIVEGMPNDVYHAGPGVSKSGLDLVALSPAHYAARRARQKARPGQLEGSMLHTALLEPNEFDARYIVGPSVNRNTKGWHAFVESLKPGQTAIQDDQREVAMLQAASLAAIPDVARLLRGSVREGSVYWTDPETNQLCRCRPDALTAIGDGVVLLDAKTFSRAKASAFTRQVEQKRYQVQDAFYSDGVQTALGVDVLAFLFAVVETEPPYAAAVFALDEPSRQQGRALYRAALDRYADCMVADSWPGYSEDVQMIGLRDWALQQTDDLG